MYYQTSVTLISMVWIYVARIHYIPICTSPTFVLICFFTFIICLKYIHDRAMQRQSGHDLVPFYEMLADLVPHTTAFSKQ